MPLIGASGAIAGVLGAYLVLYPRARVWTWIIPLFVLPLPASCVLGVLVRLPVRLRRRRWPTSGGGAAYWAHVGGFVAGALLIKPFLLGRARGRRRPRRRWGSTVWDRGGLP